MANRKGSKSQASAGPKRHRAKMACNYCRGRKIRCDCGYPCKNCVVRGRHCVYTKVTVEENRRARERKFATRKANNTLLNDEPDTPPRRPRRTQNGSSSSSTSQDRLSDSEEDARVPPVGIEEFGYDSSGQTSPDLVDPHQHQQHYQDGSTGNSFYDRQQVTSDYFNAPVLPPIMQDSLDFSAPQMPSSDSSTNLSSPVSPFLEYSDRSSPGLGSPSFDVGGWSAQTAPQVSPPPSVGPTPGSSGFGSQGPVLAAPSPPPMLIPVYRDALSGPPSPDLGDSSLPMRLQNMQLLSAVGYEAPFYPPQPWASAMGETSLVDPRWLPAVEHGQ